MDRDRLHRELRDALVRQGVWQQVADRFKSGERKWRDDSDLIQIYVHTWVTSENHREILRSQEITGLLLGERGANGKA